MSSLITQLLARNTDEIVDLNTVRQFLSSGASKNASKKQYRDFVRSAKESEIGGVGTGFERMTADQQREFIMSSRGAGARRMQQLEANYPASGRRDFVDESRKPIGSSTKSTQEYLADAGNEIYERTVGGAGRVASHVGETVAGVARGAAEATEGLGHRIDTAFINTATAGMDVAYDGGSLLFQAVRGAASGAVEGTMNIGRHAGEQIGGALSGLPHALKETGSDFVDFVSPVTRGLAGDTSGRAAANASAVFQRNYEDVFSSQVTAEAFGVDESVLKQAFAQSGDDFTATLKGGGLGDEAIEGLEAFRNEVRRVADEGGNLSSEGMQAMLRNQAEVGNMYGGFSRAGATASPNALLRGMAGEGTGMESIMGIAAVAGLAGGANVMMGGEFTEGAAVGGIGALSVRGIAKGVAGSMGDIEQSMMKSILGDDMITPGSKTVTEIIERDIKSGTRLSEIPGQYTGSVKMGEVNPHLMDYDNNAANMSIKEYLEADAARGNVVTSTDAVARQSRQFEMENVSTSQARRMNLRAIQALGDDAEQLQGFGKKQMRKLLNPNKEKNVAMNNRALVLGGGMLSGVAFTGTADRRDYRRGFNAHRGNRI